MRIEEQYMDVLQNLEFAVANLFRLNPNMTDYDVLRTYEALIRTYAAEGLGRPAQPVNRLELEAKLFQDVHSICEWRLGRKTLTGDKKGGPSFEPIDVPTLILCLKRLVKSVQKWNKHGGRQAYLEFMTQYVK